MFAPARVPPGAGPLFFRSISGGKMTQTQTVSQYLLEVQNTSPNLIVVTCPAKAPLMLTPASAGPPARVALTSEQFLSMSYDLEGFIDGKHGVKKQLTLWVTDRESGACEACPFEIGAMIARGGFSADSDAKREQDAQEAKIDAARQAILDKVKQQADASAGLASSVQAGLNTLT